MQFSTNWAKKPSGSWSLCWFLITYIVIMIIEIYKWEKWWKKFTIDMKHVSLMLQYKWRLLPFFTVLYYLVNQVHLRPKTADHSNQLHGKNTIYFHKNLYYKNIQAEINQHFKNMLRTYLSWESVIIYYYFIINKVTKLSLQFYPKFLNTQRQMPRHFSYLW